MALISRRLDKYERSQSSPDAASENQDILDGEVVRVSGLKRRLTSLDGRWSDEPGNRSNRVLKDVSSHLEEVVQSMA